MFKRSLVLGLVLSIASVANAGLTSIELVPQTPGPYAQGASVDVDVILHNMETINDTLPVPPVTSLQIRLAVLDFAGSDPALTLGAFDWDFSSLIVDALYSAFDASPKFDLTYSGSSPTAGFILDIPEGGSLRYATINVTLPAVDGTYTLDAINAGVTDVNFGGRIDYGFAARTILHTSNQNLGGGTVELTVVPEPATLALLGIGGLALLRRRRTA